MVLARGIAVQPKHLGHLMARLHARWRSWVLARSVKVGRYNLWVDAGNSRNDISRTLRSRNAPMECLRAEGTRDAHHERHTEDTGAEMGNGTRRDGVGPAGIDQQGSRRSGVSRARTPLVLPAVFWAQA